jgi:hypothetical protein
MSKRERVDAAAAAVKAVQGARIEISPPTNVPLGTKDLPFFASVLDEFARTEWTAHQLELAAMLSRTMADLEEEQRLMRIEGTIVKSDRGTPVINPRKMAIQMHYGNIHSARRSLSLHARAQDGEARDIGKRRNMSKTMAAGAVDLGELIARPN